MRFLRRHIKLIAAFLTVNFLSSLVAPNVAYALTAGPTNPDYTSFEPVDTTDMVNLMSGDLAYNLPLLEVPGPAGGYPLALSYHAGIMLNEEASWVGLGWTLNPGAINRSVNGFPDDHKNVTTTDRFFWEGGTRTQYDIGVNIGVGDMAGVSAGISIGTDTYQGFGVGGFAGVNASLFKFGENGKYGLGVNSKFGVDPWGNGYKSFGVSLGTKVEGLSLSSGVNTNFRSVGFSGGASLGYENKKDDNGNPINTSIRKGGISLVGASISSAGKGTSVSVVGHSGIVNNSASNVSTSSTGFTLPVPFVYLGFQKTRYWIDETESIETNGALYYPDYEVDKAWLDSHSYDTYYSVDADEFTFSGFPQLNGARSLGGSFANYDYYSVTGQGVSGNIRPYKFKQHLLKQNVTQNDAITQFVTGYDADQSFTWRFTNDFSNRVEHDPNNFEWSIPQALPQLTQASFDFGQLSVGEAQKSILITDGGESSLVNGLNGSRDIKTYTNKEITDGVEGFIENKSTGFARSHLPWDQIGAYVITNESGVTYHYTLPACSYDEYQYSENIERDEGHTYNELKRPEEYTYAWHLTAITGPDFVDRGLIGELDEEDWGYWVDFQYGKWTENYFWRNPGEAMNMDLDNNFQNFSEGTKELYYLDAIKTKSHTAFFVKDVREDAKSAIPILRNEKDNKVTLHEESRSGGFEPKTITCSCHNTASFGPSGSIIDKGTLTYEAKPTLSLRLDKIILISNDKLNNLDTSLGSPTYFKNYGSQYGQVTSSAWDIEHNGDFTSVGTNIRDCDFSHYGYSHHMFARVFDIHDLEYTNFENDALRIVDFDNDHYDLVPGTPNSSDGKLTLKSIQFSGKGGVSLIPPMRFQYDIDVESFTTVHEKTGDLSGLASYGNLEDWDVVEVERISDSKKAYYLFASFDVGILFKKLGGNDFAHGESVKVRKTKNAPYTKENYDNWGMYKSDLAENLCEINEAIGRRVTDESAKNVDVWSLRKVNTSLGAEIEIKYGSDYYDKVEVLNGALFTLYDIESLGDDQYRVTFNENINLSNYYKQNEIVSISSVFGLPFFHISDYDIEGFNDADYKPYTLCRNGTVRFPINIEEATIESVESDALVISTPEIAEKLNTSVIRKRELIFESRYCYSDHGYANVTFYSSQFPSRFYGGYISSSSSGNYGGGISVASISLHLQGQTEETRYTYQGGKTSYLPFGLIPPKIGRSTSSADDYHKKLIKANSYFLYSDIFKNSREIPPPGVLYGNVKVQGYVNGERVPSYEVYEFETFHAGMIDYHTEFDEDFDVSDKGWSYSGHQYHRQRKRRIHKKDFTSRVGQLKRVTVFNKDDDKLSETINHYLNDDLSYPADATDREYFDENVATYENLLASKYNSQGVIEETFADARMIKNIDRFEMLGVVSKHEHYPSVQTGTTTINYKTGISNVSANLGFDFYSGAPKLSYSEDGYGSRYVSKIIPAYRYYPQMAQKNMISQEGTSYLYQMSDGFMPENFNYGDDVKSNANGLLGASAQSWGYTYSFVDGNDLYDVSESDRTLFRPFNNVILLNLPQGEYSAGDKVYFISDASSATITIEGWSSSYSAYFVTPSFEIVAIGSSVLGKVVDQKPIFRKHKSFSYIATGLTPEDDGTIDPVSFSELPLGPISEATGWQTNSEISLYDVNSHALEASDINGNFAATKFDVNNERVIATVANARYSDFNYRDFEYLSSSITHTGSGSLDIGANNIRSFGLNLPASASKVSAWVHEDYANDFEMYLSYDGFTLASGRIDANKKSGEWYLVEAEVNWSGPVGLNFQNEGSGGTIHVDDFRMHPIDATMTSYVYNEWGELCDVLDANNLFTHYEYDAMGRLKSITRETLSHGSVKVSETEIYYSSQNP